MGVRTVSQTIDLKNQLGAAATSKYITDISNTGITVHPSTVGQNIYYTQISDGFYIKQMAGSSIDTTNDTTLTSIKANDIIVGNSSGYNTHITNQGLFLRNANTNYLSLTTNEISLGTSNQTHTVIDADSMTIYNSINKLVDIDGGITKGMIIYDGQDNNDDNILASFTNNGAVVGKVDGGHVEIGDDTFVMKDSKGGDSFKITQDEDSVATEYYTETVKPIYSGDAFMGGDPEEIVDNTPFTQVLTKDYVSDISIGFNLKVYYGVKNNYTITYTLLSTETVNLTVGSSFTHDFYINGDTSNNPLFTYEGTCSFDSTTLTASLDITSYYNQAWWQMLWYVRNWSYIKVELEPIISYKTLLLMPVVTIGRYADVTGNFADSVFAIGKATPATSGTNNIFRIARNGDTNIQGNLTAGGTIYGPLTTYHDIITNISTHSTSYSDTNYRSDVNATINLSSVACFGRIVHAVFELIIKGNWTAGNDVWGTLTYVNGYEPVSQADGVGFFGSYLVTSRLYSDNTSHIRFRNTGAIDGSSTNRTIYCSVTWIR